MIPSDPKTLGLAFLGGIIPALLWLWFWLKEEKKKSEPSGLLTFCFIIGMVAVFFVLPIERFIQGHVGSHELQTFLWVWVEELAKFLVAIAILFKTEYIEEPLDWPILLITIALGFAAMENTLFLIKPFSLGEVTVGLLTGQLRFLGSTLLHAVSTGTIGIALGLSFHMTRTMKTLYVLVGLMIAVSLHSIFNFFIIKDSGSNFLQVFAFLWVVTIIIMLLFEKLRRIS